MAVEAALPWTLRWVELGTVGYEEARREQELRVRERLSGIAPDTCFLLEHPAVLTLGRRRTAESARAAAESARRGVTVVETDRGGEATYHGPGQLVLYPVIHLPSRRLGIRRFVEIGLNALTDSVRSFGVEAHTKLDPAGVWVGRKKIAAVGLRVERGVTCHGFSLNISNDLSVYDWFLPCGISGAGTTSMAAELGYGPSDGDVRAAVRSAVERRLFGE